MMSPSPALLIPPGSLVYPDAGNTEPESPGGRPFAMRTHCQHIPVLAELPSHVWWAFQSHWLPGFIADNCARSLWPRALRVGPLGFVPFPLAVLSAAGFSSPAGYAGCPCALLGTINSPVSVLRQPAESLTNAVPP